MTVRNRQTATWRYFGGGTRDLRLDLLRGFAVFAMAVDHVGGDSPFHLLSGGNRFFVSAAEAFVFISGVTVGFVYGRPAETARSIVTRAWKRSWSLYMVSVWLAVAFAAAAAAAGIPKGVPFEAQPARFIFDVVTLQRSYYLVEVMLLYAFLLALVPLIILGLRHRLWWAVVLASFGLWQAFQLWPNELVLPWRIVDYQNFPLAAWQILFVAGVVLGYFRQPIGEALSQAPRLRLPGGWFGPLAIVVAVLVWLHVTDASALDGWRGDGAGAGMLDSWFDKRSLPLPRLVACAVVFAFAWQLTTRCWQPLRRVAGPFLMPLGNSALYAYSTHVLAACVIEIAVFHLHGTGALSMAQSFLIQSAMLATVWFCSRFRVLQPQISWLGNPPLAAAGRALRPGASLGALGVLLVVCLILTPRQGAEGDFSFTGGATDVRRAAYNNPVTTVTPPRASLKQPAPAASSSPGDEEPNGETVSAPDADPLLARSLAPEFQVVAGVLDEGFIPSVVLGREMPYAVYLPPSYTSEPERRFPVLYLLHGAGGGYTEWAQDGLPQAAAAKMAAGDLAEFIIVMPEGGKAYWANGLTGLGERWADYVDDEVVPFIDSSYRTIPERAQRAIGGLSRGGFGSLYLAFSRPDLFSIVGANSPSLPGEVADIDEVLVTQDLFSQFDPVELARQLDPAMAPRIYLDVGDEDDWQPGVKLLDAVLTARGIDHEFSIGQGGHVPEYWAPRAALYLDFYGAEFRLNGAG